MLNFNNVPVSEAPKTEFSLIPDNTICRAVMVVKVLDIEIPEFGAGTWFKQSQTSKAKWMELELTVVGGEFDRRKFWHKIFVDGEKLGESGMPVAKEIGLQQLRKIIDSMHGLDPSDMSEAAQQRRNISGVNDLNAMEICAKVGIKKGTNGYADQNQLKVALTPADTGYIAAGQIPPQTTPSGAQSAPAAQPSNGAVPAWANR